MQRAIASTTGGGLGDDDRFGASLRLRVGLHWPTTDDYVQEFFLGGWSGDHRIELEDDAKASPGLARLSGPNYFLIASNPGLLTPRAVADAPGLDAIAFRGYLLDPVLSVRSDPGDRYRFWSGGPDREYNGVFAAALVGGGGRDLTLLGDAFGVSPLYYRRLGAAVFFSTNPRYLLADGDRPDMLAWSMVMSAGYVPCDWTLTVGVSRLPAGRRLRFSAAGLSDRAWFDMGSLARATEAVTPAAVEQVQALLDRAVQRCAGVTDAEPMLPLTSGYDSRRLLVSLVRQKVPFEAWTVHAFHKGHRDLDAPGAAELSRRFGFPHKVIELPPAAGFAEADRTRRRFVDCETTRHSWSIPLWRRLTAAPRLVFDGLAGDVFGETGFEDPLLLTENEEGKAAGIAAKVVGESLSRALSAAAWPTVETRLAAVQEFVNELPEGENRAELAFLLLQTRRHTAPWSQQLAPPGAVIVYPYLDLDYARFLLSLEPLPKIETSLQETCLHRFAPEYDVPGSRQIPVDSRPVATRIDAANAAACIRLLEEEVRTGRDPQCMTSLLSFSGRALRLGARISIDAALSRECRWLAPLLALVSRETYGRRCLEIGPA